MKTRFKILIALALSLFAGVAAANYLGLEWDGIRIGKISVATSGTKINRIEVVNLAFAGDTAKTATVTAIDSGASYYVFSAWKSCSANQAKPETVAISGTTLTGTAVSATTGTLSVMVVQTP